MNNTIGISVNEFISPEGTPFNFKVELEPDRLGYSFRVTANTGNNFKTCNYRLEETSQSAYLDMFENLSRDFKLRMPRNRMAEIAPVFNVKYQEVLQENLHEDMLYGYGDPAVIRVEKEQGDVVYYLVSTSNDAANSFPIIRSDNLKDWTFVGYVFPKGKKPEWAAYGELISDYWAPEMHKVADEYRVYFVARDKATRELCIGMAASVSPEGPFEAATEPVIRGNVIDPHLFIQDNQTAYLYWKEDNNDLWPGALLEILYNYANLIARLFDTAEDQITASFTVTLWPLLQKLEPMERFQLSQLFIESVIDRYTEIYRRLEHLAQEELSISKQILKVLQLMKTPMFAQQLNKAGTALIGERTKILENDLEWEAHLVEGMWVTAYENKYYLFYAGNDFSTENYGIGVAVADHPLGPYTKMSAPFLQSTAKWRAPGHPSVTQMPNGEPIMFLHAYAPGKAGYKQFRALLAVPLSFKDGLVTVKAS